MGKSKPKCVFNPDADLIYCTNPPTRNHPNTKINLVAPPLNAKNLMLLFIPCTNSLNVLLPRPPIA